MQTYCHPHITDEEIEANKGEVIIRDVFLMREGSKFENHALWGQSLYP